jgi:hypothetical protein
MAIFWHLTQQAPIERGCDWSEWETSLVLLHIKRKAIDLIPTSPFLNLPIRAIARRSSFSRSKTLVIRVHFVAFLFIYLELP